MLSRERPCQGWEQWMEDIMCYNRKCRSSFGKINELLRNSQIKKDRMFLKYLKDTVEFFINLKHEFDPEVVEFSSTIGYLGGRKTFNFIWGLMFYKQGKGFR